VADSCAAVLREEPLPISAVASTVPAGVDTIVLRCLEKRPEERFQSARDLMFALQAAATPSAATAQRPRVGPLRDSESDRGASARIRSIAVLPFVTAEADDELEYLADGLTEGLIGRLSGVTGLDRVIARHSVFRYKESDVDPVTVGRELGVDAVLVGDVTARGEALVVRAELIGTERENCIWGDRFSSGSDSIHRVEESISRGVIGTLGVQLTRDERQQVERKHTDNPEAYRMYLRGRHLWNKRSPESLERSIKLYREAIDLDPRFALPHVGIADSLVSLYYVDVMTKSVVYRDALPAVLAALDLDNGIAESHMALGSVVGYLGYDWQRSEREYRLALELNPRNAEAFHQYAHVLSLTGREDQAVETMSRAHDLDPVSSIFNSCMGQVLYLARRYGEAVTYCETSMELEPANPHPYPWCGMAHIQRGEHEAADRIFTRGLDSPTLAARIRGAWGYSHAVRGDRDRALAQLDEMARLAEDSIVDPCYEAWVHCALGENDAALTKLEEAFHGDTTWVVFLKVDPFFDAVRDHPRYRKLLENLNLLEV
jgi:serine/threonine-protein kinase